MIIYYEAGSFIKSKWEEIKECNKSFVSSHFLLYINKVNTTYECTELRMARIERGQSSLIKKISTEPLYTDIENKKLRKLITKYF